MGVGGFADALRIFRYLTSSSSGTVLSGIPVRRAKYSGPSFFRRITPIYGGISRVR
jgi:hypothetical protein